MSYSNEILIHLAIFALFSHSSIFFFFIFTMEFFVMTLQHWILLQH